MPASVAGIHDLSRAQTKSRMAGTSPAMTAGFKNPTAGHFTPSFFCRLDEEVVYWKISFLSG
jgi:hypothetical protein